MTRADKRPCSGRRHHRSMPARDGPIARASAAATASLQDGCREIRAARVGRGIDQAAVARACGLSRSQVSRIERGLVDSVPFTTLLRLGSTVGLDGRLRFFPGGAPIRDAAHVALLERLRGCLGPGFTWATEVPLPIRGDQRAWDAMISRRTIRIGIEAETRIRDLQGAERRIQLKKRDGGVDQVILLLTDSRWNRDAIRAAGGAALASFPVNSATALERLRRGLDPGGDAVMFL